jgi:hypothetical protein
MYDEIAAILIGPGLLTRIGNSYGAVRIVRIQQRYGLKGRYDRLQEAGYLTDEETAKLLGVSPKTIAERRKRGLLNAARVNDRPEYRYERPVVRR